MGNGKANLRAVSHLKQIGLPFHQLVHHVNAFPIHGHMLDIPTPTDRRAKAIGKHRLPSSGICPSAGSTHESTFREMSERTSVSAVTSPSRYRSKAAPCRAARPGTRAVVRPPAGGGVLAWCVPPTLAILLHGEGQGPCLPDLLLLQLYEIARLLLQLEESEPQLGRKH